MLPHIIDGEPSRGVARISTLEFQGTVSTLLHKWKPNPNIIL